MVAFRSLTHSLHVIKTIMRFQRSQQYAQFLNWIAGSKDIARYGEPHHTKLMGINFITLD